MDGKRKATGPRVLDDIAPNLIPMVDIMFLLLLFLMLGADMGQRQLEDVVLPSAERLRDGNQDLATVVNVCHREGVCPVHGGGGVCSDRSHWAIRVRGADVAPAGLGVLLGGQDGPAAGRVLIRADRSALYEYVQAVIEACARARIDKVEIGATEHVAG